MANLFDQNKKVIKAIAPGLISRIEALSEYADGLRCFPSRTGSPTCKAKNRDGRWVTLHSTMNPEKEGDLVFKKIESAGDGIVVLLGIGLGYPLLGLLARHDLRKRTMIIVESDLGLFKKGLESCDWSVLSDANDVHLLVEEPVEAVLKTITQIRMKRGFQDLILIPHASSVRRDPEFFTPLLHELDLLKHSPFKPRPKVPSLAHGPLTVLILDADYFLIPECVKALKTLGHRVVEVPTHQEGLIERILGCVAREKPDFLLSINHLGFDEEGRMTELLESLGLPFAVWYVDSPTFIVLNGRDNVSPHGALFLWERSYLDAMKAYGFQKIFFLPLATDPSVFRPIRPDTIPAHFRGTISFVGNSMVEAVSDWFARFPNNQITETITRLAVPRQIENHGQSMEQILRSIALEHGHEVRFEDPVHHLYLQAALVWKATLEYRRDLLERLEPFQIRVFGDKGWHRLLNGGVRILPPVNYHRDLPFIFNGTDVNINATSFQMVSAVNQRVFDTAACGAFLVTDHQPDMDELFDRTRETVCYDDPAEAKEQVAYYLKHPRVRCEIAQRARDRVLGEHTYVHRLTKMIAVMKHEFGSF